MTNATMLRLDTSGPIATVTLNRPDRLNAFNTAMLEELLAALDRLDADDAIRAVVVTGAGRAFCAGADLSSGVQGFTDDIAGAAASRDGGGRLALRLFACRKPVIGAINGAAVGVGATMLLPMDIRVASTSARFGFVQVRRGIVPEAASSWFLPRVVGISRAVEWACSGRMVDAEEALAAGLLRAVVPPQDLLSAAHALALTMVDQAAPVSVALARQMMWRMLGAAHPMEAHRLESRAVALRSASADAREGVAAFLEKRPAKFSDQVSDGMPDCLPDDPDY